VRHTRTGLEAEMWGRIQSYAEHRLHTQAPHCRQWCRRLKGENFSWHTLHT
jgi:hypothetical protein